LANKKLEKNTLSNELKKEELLNINSQLDNFHKMKDQFANQELNSTELLVVILAEISKLNTKKAAIDNDIQIVLPVDSQNVENLRLFSALMSEKEC